MTKRYFGEGQTYEDERGRYQYDFTSEPGEARRVDVPQAAQKPRLDYLAIQKMGDDELRDVVGGMQYDAQEKNWARQALVTRGLASSPKWPGSRVEQGEHHRARAATRERLHLGFGMAGISAWARKKFPQLFW